MRIQSTFLSSFFLMFIYLLRERERMSDGGGKREGERKSEAGNMPGAEPDVGLHLMTLRP